MRDAKASGRPPVPTLTARTLAVVAVLGLLFGLLGMGEIAEDHLRMARNSINQTGASGQVVFVAIDEKAQRQAGNWPWPRSVQGKLIDQIDRAGARLILLDLKYDFATSPSEDAAFATALARSGKVVLPVRDRSGEGLRGRAIANLPIPPFAAKAKLGTISTFYNYQSAVWNLPLAGRIGKTDYPSFGALIAGQTGAAGSDIKIDYRYRLSSIPRFSAGDVLSGRVPTGALAGKAVVVGQTLDGLGDQYMIPGYGREGGSYVQIFGAETLLHGRPVDLGWIPAALAAFALVLWLAHKPTRHDVIALSSASLALLLLPMPLEPRHVFVDVTPGLFVLILAGSIIARRSYRLRGFTNSATGLPNLNALKASRKTNDQALVVARVLNYPQLSAALTGPDELRLVEQIVARLGVGKEAVNVFQGDEGIFAWLMDPGSVLGHHVEALSALFRSPARINGNSYDLAVTFGVEIGSGREIASRLASALVAADEAATEGLKWKYHDPERFKDENWRLSLLAQLDAAIDSGEVWVAFQPQLDIASGRIRGAEALARWTHPDKGPITPHEFISAAEAHGRIDRLTLYMLDRAIAAAAEINKHSAPFDIAVNLSAKTLARRSLPAEVRGLLEKHKLDPARLTLELTETAALADDGSDLDPLIRLRDLGVRLSIDDYGTGLSTLEYLRKVPAQEIKIDQSFIKALGVNRSDLIMVKSTIALAHSLGQTVVAEGVEDETTLKLLEELGCDAAQGFLISRPASLDGLKRKLTLKREIRAA